MMDSYYTKDYEKTKKNITKVREVREETVRKFFLQGDCEVLVVFEETGREILIDDFSSDEDIRKYLGPKFINKKRYPAQPCRISLHILIHLYLIKLLNTNTPEHAPALSSSLQDM